MAMRTSAEVWKVKRAMATDAIETCEEVVKRKRRTEMEREILDLKSIFTSLALRPASDSLEIHNFWLPYKVNRKPRRNSQWLSSE